MSEEKTGCCGSTEGTVNSENTSCCNATPVQPQGDSQDQQGSVEATNTQSSGSTEDAAESASESTTEASTASECTEDKENCNKPAEECCQNKD